jgi:hypothetical protein
VCEVWHVPRSTVYAGLVSAPADPGAAKRGPKTVQAHTGRITTDRPDELPLLGIEPAPFEPLLAALEKHAPVRSAELARVRYPGCHIHEPPRTPRTLSRKLLLSRHTPPPPVSRTPAVDGSLAAVVDDQ